MFKHVPIGIIILFSSLDCLIETSSPLSHFTGPNNQRSQIEKPRAEYTIDKSEVKTNLPKLESDIKPITLEFRKCQKKSGFNTASAMLQFQPIVENSISVKWLEGDMEAPIQSTDDLNFLVGAIFTGHVRSLAFSTGRLSGNSPGTLWRSLEIAHQNGGIIEVEIASASEIDTATKTASASATLGEAPSGALDDEEHPAAPAGPSVSTGRLGTSPQLARAQWLHRL